MMEVETVHVIEDEDIPWSTPTDYISCQCPAVNLSRVPSSEELIFDVEVLDESRSMLLHSDMEFLRSLPFPMQVLAKSGGPVATMEYLRQKGLSVNSCDLNSFTPLHYAAKFGKFKVVEYLCNKCDLNAKTPMGNTAVLLAAQKWHIDIVELLVNCGADISSFNNNKWSLLHYASSRGWPHTVKLCLSLNCDINMKATNMNTPLLLAAADENKGVVKLLIERGADVNLTDKNAWTILHYAVVENWLDIAQLCVNAKCDLNAKNDFMKTPTLLAAEKSHTDMLEYLVKCGADVSIRDDEGWNILHWSAYKGWTQVLLNFIETCSGHNTERIILLNCKNDEGDTLLHIALTNKHIEMVKILLESGADCNLENNVEETAFQQALFDALILRSENILNLEVVLLFLEYGGLIETLEYMKIFSHPVFKERILKDSELCSRTIINAFNNKYLPAIYKLPGSVENLPSIEKLKIKSMQCVAHDITKSVENEIQTNGFCDLTDSKRPIVLKMLCVKSLNDYSSALKRQSEYDFDDDIDFIKKRRLI